MEYTTEKRGIKTKEIISSGFTHTNCSSFLFSYFLFASYPFTQTAERNRNERTEVSYFFFLCFVCSHTIYQVIYGVRIHQQNERNPTENDYRPQRRMTMRVHMYVIQLHAYTHTCQMDRNKNSMLESTSKTQPHTSERKFLLVAACRERYAFQWYWCLIEMRCHIISFFDIHTHDAYTLAHIHADGFECEQKMRRKN